MYNAAAIWVQVLVGKSLSTRNSAAVKDLAIV
jgi:hypothetical protein